MIIGHRTKSKTKVPIRIVPRLTTRNGSGVGVGVSIQKRRRPAAEIRPAAKIRICRNVYETVKASEQDKLSMVELVLLGCP